MDSSSKLKVILGAILLLAGSALILFVSSAGEAILPGIVGSIAVLVVAAGTLMVGTSEGEGRPV